VLAAASLASALCAFAEPVLAQKSEDTLRFPVRRSEHTLDPYLNPGVFDNVWEPALYDTLLAFDSKKQEFAPALAKSWSQPSPTVYEFDLRDDVLWHDGEKFDADDVVYFIGYLIDPKVALRYKANWAWIEKVEKLGSHKVRITAKQPVPYGLMWMASSTYIFPQHKHAPLANKEDFGGMPVGTGPYKMTKFDKNSGLAAEKNANFKPTAAKYAASIGKVLAETIPDTGTLVAAMLINKADMALNLPADQAQGLKDSGRFEVTLSPPGLEYTFFGFPTAAWRENKALSDVRVRKAIIHATNRKELIDIQFGSLQKGIQPHEHLCAKEQLGCGYTKPVPEFDPALSKKLLAEAGYAGGFEVIVSTTPNRSTEATAFAGMLRAVGIRASVAHHTTPQRLKLIQDGKVQIGYYGWSGGSIFEVSPVLARHVFSEEYDDGELRKLASGGDTIMDDKARRAHLAKAFDYLYDNALAFAMLPSMATFTHSKELRMKEVGVRETLVNPQDFEWK
jgi:peptide/nickel transport system substrate-binding protein